MMMTMKELYFFAIPCQRHFLVRKYMAMDISYLDKVITKLIQSLLPNLQRQMWQLFDKRYHALYPLAEFYTDALSKDVVFTDIL